MLTLDEIRSFRGFLLSERVTLKGSEIPAFELMLGALNREEAALVKANMQSRVQPAEK
jgi:hypothetical protein